MEKKITSKVWIDDYKITFSYETKRKNKKEQTRVVTQTEQKAAERTFWLWINIENEDRPYRAMSNVKILDIVKTNGRYIEL